MRGKILNVEKAQEHKIYDNEEIKNMITALGVSFGTEDDEKGLNMEKLRLPQSDHHDGRRRGR